MRRRVYAFRAIERVGISPDNGMDNAGDEFGVVPDRYAPVLSAPCCSRPSLRFEAEQGGS